MATGVPDPVEGSTQADGLAFGSCVSMVLAISKDEVRNVNTQLSERYARSVLE